MQIQLLVLIPDSCSPKLSLEFNNQLIEASLSDTPNKHGHYSLQFDVEPAQKNIIKLSVTGLGELSDDSNYVNVVESIIDGINFGIVHLMNTWAYHKGLDPQKGATQLDSDGHIEIPFNLPVCNYWCEVNNNFKHKDYPLWTN